MALMILKRLPNEDELEQRTVEAHSFLNAFSENQVAPFVAKVKKTSSGVKLGDWLIDEADWFSIVD